MKRLSWKYVAGLIDGEGCFDFSRNGTKYLQPRVRVTMTEPGKKVIDLLYNNYGGTLYCRGKSEKNPDWQNAYTWQLEGRRMLGLVQRIKNHLIIKKSQAEFIVSYITTYLGKALPDETRNRLYQELKDLKRDPQRLSDPALFKCEDIQCVMCSSVVPYKKSVAAAHGKEIIRFCCSDCKAGWLERRNGKISRTKRDAIVQNALEAVTSA